MSSKAGNRTPRNAIWNLLLCSALIMTTGCSFLRNTTVKDSEQANWVGTWSTSIEPISESTMPPDPPGLKGSTLRQIVHVSIGGDQLRVRFSNTFGGRDSHGLTILGAAVAVSDGADRIRPETSMPLTFLGQPSVTIAPGALMISDPVEFDIEPLSSLAVTMQVHDTTCQLSGHRGARCTTYLLPGDAVEAPSLPEAATATSWYYLAGVDVPAGHGRAAVAVIGDSITDGKGSTTDGNGRWPDFLARRLQANPATDHIAVMNHGIGGNALLRGGLSHPVVARLDRDILAQPGVSWLIVLIGINDLAGHRSTADELIAAYRQVILRARDRGLRVYGATIMPCGGSNYLSAEAEADRLAINDWIRDGGAFDAVIDMDAALRDPANPARLRPEADSGDHLHLNDHGHSMMADTVDLTLFVHHRHR